MQMHITAIKANLVMSTHQLSMTADCLSGEQDPCRTIAQDKSWIQPLFAADDEEQIS
jgi:hypothetical protein